MDLTDQKLSTYVLCSPSTVEARFATHIQTPSRPLLASLSRLKKYAKSSSTLFFSP